MSICLFEAMYSHFTLWTFFQFVASTLGSSSSHNNPSPQLVWGNYFLFWTLWSHLSSQILQQIPVKVTTEAFIEALFGYENWKVKNRKTMGWIKTFQFFSHNMVSFHPNQSNKVSNESFNLKLPLEGLKTVLWCIPMPWGGTKVA